jgi:hypothetical protein
MFMFALCFGCAGTACDPAQEPVRAALLPLAPEAGQASPARPAGLKTAPRRGRLLGGERVARVPRWPAATRIDHEVLGRAPAALRAAVERSPVPVLVPADPSWLARASLYVPDEPQAYGYAFAGTLVDPKGERHLSVMASRFATLLPHLLPRTSQVRGSAVRSGEGFFSVNEGVRTASWIEHGVAYTLDLECFDPEAANCDDATLRQLVAALVYVGGAATNGAAS